MIRSLVTIFVLFLGAVAFAQVAPAAPASGFSLASLGAIAGIAVLIINALLSAAQAIFSALGKAAPAWFVPVANVMLWITQHLAGNPPSVIATQTKAIVAASDTTPKA